MRSVFDRDETTRDLRRRLEGLEGLPLRPTTVRELLVRAEQGDHESPWPEVAEQDPGVALALLRPYPEGDNPIALAAERPWWPKDAEEPLGRLWRHGMAVSCAARRFAAEEEIGDPARWARIGLIHNLGLWALAAVNPEVLSALLAEPDPALRRDLERAWLGVEATELGRNLAERWGCDPTLVDATWLHADLAGDLSSCAHDPGGLNLLQRALACAERTPWALTTEQVEPGPGDPRQRLLTAEVQVRCGFEFVAPDASIHEERVSRSYARLHRRASDLERGLAARDRFLQAVAVSDPTEGLQSWADRAALSWCAEPGVASARVVWTGVDPKLPSPSTEEPKATLVVPLGRRGRPLVEVQLRVVPDGPPFDPEQHPAGPAWHAWADLVADRDRLAGRLAATLAAHRQRVETGKHELRQAKLEALAEFAAGAGHELNNPLAVIQGRAQLLLAEADDPGMVRSLRAIISQAQRAHRMLRDLMYIARPPIPRPRACRPDELVLSCVRDLQDEAEFRKVRLLAEPGGAASAWTDPDPLRHLAEVLLRNALEATPAGGTVRITTSGDAKRLDWVVRDGGRGLDLREGRHLLDPFFCGRQAGRGLGLGLPRAARAAALAGGALTWRSSPGRGTSFHLSMPLGLPPEGAEAFPTAE